MRGALPRPRRAQGPVLAAYADDLLLWVRTDWIARGPAGKQVKGYRSTGVLAGDAAPGGARRR
ncbi:hypothetical protein OG204_13955 [Streptomyces sp. NBC_01387]|uniref:hypothetical protein n=1 Tax=unclassified Streptomyces TaxID=2593676 RepID=UPI002024B0B3|nr:hypothetical protein [Streptomyces sp. A 4/2]